jgi:hypothetical protein
MLVRRLVAVLVVSVLSFWVMDSATLRVASSSGYAATGAAGGAPLPDEVPPYHNKAPRKELPPTMDPLRFPDGITRNAYAMAGKIKEVLYQQPCFCHCDREYGHASLLECFTGTHASVCNICKMEAIYAYNETAKRKTAAQIREGIINGDYQKIDLARYVEYKPPSD